MTGKEHITKSLRFQETGTVPFYLMRRPEIEEKVKEHMQVEDIDTAMGSSMAQALLAIPPSGEESGTSFTEYNPEKDGVEAGIIFRDEFGVGYESTKQGGACPRVHPLAESPSLDDFPWPDPADPRRYEPLQKKIEKRTDQFLLVIKYCGLFERSWFLRDMENLLIDFYQDEGYVTELLDRLLEFNLEIVRNLVQYDVDGIMLGDDWGSQGNLIISPEQWRKFIKPRYAKLYDEIKSAGIFVFMHSCGNILQIIPDLIEIGVDCLNPIQVIAMDPAEVKRKFGDRISLFGGVSTQKTFPYGTPDDVRDEVKERTAVLGKGGGYILAPDQELQMDAPLENILAFIDAARNQ